MRKGRKGQEPQPTATVASVHASPASSGELSYIPQTGTKQKFEIPEAVRQMGNPPQKKAELKTQDCMVNVSLER